MQTAGDRRVSEAVAVKSLVGAVGETAHGLHLVPRRGIEDAVARSAALVDPESVQAGAPLYGVTGAAVHGHEIVVAGPAVHNIVAIAALQAIHAVAAVERIVAGQAQEDVVARFPEQLIVG